MIATTAVHWATKWAESENDLLRRYYSTLTGPELAARLGRPLANIYAQAKRLGLKKPQTVIDAVFLGRVRSLHGEGCTDQEIADTLGCNYRTAAKQRKRLGLPLSARTRVKLRIAGEESGKLRRLAREKYAAASGWPTDLGPRAVDILNLLSTHGPMTRRELCDAMGVHWSRVNGTLGSRGSGKTYLADLIARGLIVSLGRIVAGEGPGHSCHLYSLSMAAERRYPDGAA